MYSFSVRRVARSSVTASTSACKAATNAPLAVSTQCLAYRRHQRRNSSSKTSCPPHGARGAHTQTARTPARATTEGEKRAIGRHARRRAKEAAAESVTGEKDDAFSYLPSVPSTQHLHPGDIAISSFFSLHRPISVTTSFPPSTTQESFNTMFEPKTQRKHIVDTIYTLASAVETIEASSKTAEEKDLRFEILQQSSSNAEGVQHLDGAPVPRQINVEALLKQFRPFNVPPAPVPFADAGNEEDEGAQAATREDAGARLIETEARPKRKDYTTTIRVTELIYPNGSRSISASASPIVRTTPPAPTSRILPPTFFSSRILPAPYAQRNVQIRQPFLERMRIRQQRWEEAQDERFDNEGEGEGEARKMWAISVKRQRKLKMKKHKYKKLMRKTRTLRRRLDRT